MYGNEPTRRGCSDGAIADLGDAQCPDVDQELPGLEDEVHGEPDAAAATSIASGLEDGLSSAEMADGQGTASPVRLGNCSWAE
jgi:hypothetical protein